MCIAQGAGRMEDMLGSCPPDTLGEVSLSSVTLFDQTATEQGECQSCRVDTLCRPKSSAAGLVHFSFSKITGFCGRLEEDELATSDYLHFRRFVVKCVPEPRAPRGV